MTGICVTSLSVKGRDPRFRAALVFPAVFLFLFYAGISVAQEESRQYITATQQMELADQFFREGDYVGAIREYKRFLFFYPHSNRTEEALLKKARSFFRGQKWEEALSACDHLVSSDPAPLVKSEAFRIRGDIMAVQRQYAEARISFGKAREAAPSTGAADEAQFQIARTYLREEKWKEATDEFRKIDKTSKLFPQSDFLAQGLDRIAEVPQKSPAVAEVLSALLPGAGQAYCGEYGRAALSFLLNGAFIWGIVESFRNDNKVVGGILILFEVGLYSANVLNAINRAEKYNRKKTQEYINGLERGSGISLVLSVQERTPMLAFRYIF